MKPTVSAIITAGGDGTRFGRDKMMVYLKDRQLLLYTLEKFHQSKYISEIVVLVKEKNIKKYQKIINKAGFKVKIVPAAPKRITSVYYGIKASEGEYVITHDGNRPLTPVYLIDKLVKEVIKYKAVMTAVPPTATIKYSQDIFIEKSLPRNKTWIAQTPQGFERNLALKAFKKAIEEKYFVSTDDSELVTRLGEKVKIIPGHEINIKITFPQDLVIAENLLNYSKEIC